MNLDMHKKTPLREFYDLIIYFFVADTSLKFPKQIGGFFLLYF